MAAAALELPLAAQELSRTLKRAWATPEDATPASAAPAAAPSPAAGRWPPPLAVALACRALAFCGKCVLRHAAGGGGGLPAGAWAGLPGAVVDAAVGTALAAAPAPPAALACPCCSGVLQGGGAALACSVPVSSAGGSSSVLLNTAGLGRASVAQDVVQGVAAQAQAEAQAAAAGRAPHAEKSGAAAAAAARAAAPADASLPRSVFAAAQRRPLRHHVATRSWLADVAAFVAAGGYDLREGLALSIAVQPGFEEAEAAARARLCAALGVRGVPHSARAPDAKELLRAALSQALERIVYDSQRGWSSEDGPPLPAEGEAAAGEAGRGPAIVLSVVQAERAVARLLEAQKAPAAAVAPASEGADGAAAPSHVQRLVCTLSEDVDARALVAAVSEAVLLDARLAQASPLLSGDADAPGASLVVPVALQEAAALGLGAADQAAAARAIAGNKRPRDVAGICGEGAPGDADGTAAADADRFVGVRMRGDAAVVSMGLVDASCDYRTLLASGATGGVYVGNLAAAGFGAGGAAAFSTDASAGRLRRLVVSQASSLKLSVAVDATPPGLFLVTAEEDVVVEGGDAGAESLPTPPARVALTTASLQRGSFFLKGRYCKFRRGLSQTPWFVEGQRKAPTSSPAPAPPAQAPEGAVAACCASASASASSAAEAAGTSVEELLGSPIAAAVARWGGQGCAVGLLREDAAPPAADAPALLDAAALAGMARFAGPARGGAAAAAAELRAPPRFKFHAAGREDVDVRMLGAGRHFAIELVNARACLMPLAPLLRLHVAVNAHARGLLETSALSPASRDEFARLAAGADGKRKSYTALVWSSAPHDDAQLRARLDARVADLVLRQRTPVRVLHRRSLMERRKVVHAARTQRLGPHFFLLHLVTSAGTYVKEFVHGDLGRTRPSVGELLGEAAGGARVAADILMLDVTGIVSGAGAEGGNGGGEEGSEDDED